MWSMLSGKKTYLTAIGMVCYAVLGVYLEQVDMQEAITLCLEACGFAAVRNGIK